MCQINPVIEEIQSKVTLVTKNQDVLLESLHGKNEKLLESNSQKEIEAAMLRIKYYHMKLVNIKKDMLHLKEHTQKMKQRSQKLEVQKQKQEAKHEEQRKKVLEQENSLIAKQATSSHADAS